MNNNELKKIDAEDLKKAFINSLKNILVNKNLISKVNNVNNSSVFNLSKINNLDENGLAALHYAALFNNLNIVRLLINSSANVDIKSSKQFDMKITQHHYHIIKQNLNPIHLLIESLNSDYLPYKNLTKSSNEKENNIIGIISLILNEKIDIVEVIDFFNSNAPLPINQKIYTAILVCLPTDEAYAKNLRSTEITESNIISGPFKNKLNKLIKNIIRDPTGIEKLFLMKAFNDYNKELNNIIWYYLLKNSTSQRSLDNFKKIIDTIKSDISKDDLKKYLLYLLKKVIYEIKTISSGVNKNYNAKKLFYKNIRSMLYTELEITSYNQLRIYKNMGLTTNSNSGNIRTVKEILQKYYPVNQQSPPP